MSEGYWPSRLLGVVVAIIPSPLRSTQKKETTVYGVGSPVEPPTRDRGTVAMQLRYSTYPVRNARGET